MRLRVVLLHGGRFVMFLGSSETSFVEWEFTKVSWLRNKILFLLILSIVSEVLCGASGGIERGNFSVDGEFYFFDTDIDQTKAKRITFRMTIPSMHMGESRLTGISIVPKLTTDFIGAHRGIFIDGDVYHEFRGSAGCRLVQVGYIVLGIHDLKSKGT